MQAVQKYAVLGNHVRYLAEKWGDELFVLTVQAQSLHCYDPGPPDDDHQGSSPLHFVNISHQQN